MTATYYEFKLGRFDCLAVADGQHVYQDPGALLFPHAPKDLLARALAPYGKDPDKWREWTSDYTCLLVDTGSHRVLMDMGAGSTLPGAGHLKKNLRALGIDPETIDMVLISHAHPDHIGSVFPNARLVIQDREWAFWNTTPALPRLSPEMRSMLIRAVDGRLPALSGRIEQISKETRILPGIQTLDARGHTPGHMAVSVTSSGRELLYAGDAFLHPVHMAHPKWSAAVDVIPKQAVSTRQRLLARAVARDSLVFCFHFPFPGLGRVREMGETWQWVPV